MENTFSTTTKLLQAIKLLLSAIDVLPLSEAPFRTTKKCNFFCNSAYFGMLAFFWEPWRNYVALFLRGLYFFHALINSLSLTNATELEIQIDLYPWWWLFWARRDFDTKNIDIITSNRIESNLVALLRFTSFNRIVVSIR